MSIKAMTWAWSQTTHNPTEKLILIALADYADKNGDSWPAIQTLCERTQLSRSSVYGSLKSLEGQGLLRQDWITRERSQPVKSYSLSCIKRAPESVQQVDEPVQEMDTTVQVADKSVQQVDEPVQEMDCIYNERTTTEPSIEPPLEPIHPPAPASGGAAGGEKSKPTKRDAAIAFQQVWNLNRGTLPAIRVVTEKLAIKLAIRLASQPLREVGLLIPDDYVRLVQALAASDFHSGGGARGWRASAEWLLNNDENPLKALELAETQEKDDDPTVTPQPPPLTPEEQADIDRQFAELRA